MFDSEEHCINPLNNLQALNPSELTFKKATNNINKSTKYIHEEHWLYFCLKILSQNSFRCCNVSLMHTEPRRHFSFLPVSKVWFLQERNKTQPQGPWALQHTQWDSFQQSLSYPVCQAIVLTKPELGNCAGQRMNGRDYFASRSGSRWLF